MQHKWHKEIKAWADGADVEARRLESWGWSDWTCVSNVVFNWYEDEVHEYRIKPQPKEPQYLYVYQDNYGVPHFHWSKIEPLKTDLVLQGKIKLENDDE